MTTNWRTVGAVVAVGIAAALMGAAGLAWACTYEPRNFTLSALAGPRSTPLTVTGHGLSPEGMVELRWNGVTGPTLASVAADSKGDFSTQVTVPDVRPNVYTIVAVAGAQGLAQGSFEVLPDAGRAASPGAAAAVVPEPARPWSPSPELATDRTEAGDSTALGVGLLAGGLVTIFGSFAVVASRRRRLAATDAAG